MRAKPKPTLPAHLPFLQHINQDPLSPQVLRLEIYKFLTPFILTLCLQAVTSPMSLALDVSLSHPRCSPASGLPHQCEPLRFSPGPLQWPPALLPIAHLAEELLQHTSNRITPLLKIP